VRTDQVHFTQIQMAHQRCMETPREFLDRCRILTRMTIPRVTDRVLQHVYYAQAERMFLASFPAGVTGTTGRQVRFSMPGKAKESLRIGFTEAQAEIQEMRNETFYLNLEREVTLAGRIREPAHRRISVRTMGQ
jgi:hypothetical protein